MGTRISVGIGARMVLVGSGVSVAIGVAVADSVTSAVSTTMGSTCSVGVTMFTGIHAVSIVPIKIAHSTIEVLHTSFVGYLFISTSAEYT